MISRGKTGSAWSAASLVASSLLFAPPAPAAATPAPFHPSLVAPPPPIVQQFSATRAQADETNNDLFASLRNEMSPLALLSNSRKLTNIVEGAILDVADALITDEQRAFAAALEAWTSRADSAERRKQRKTIAAVYARRGFEPFWHDGENWRPAAVAAARRSSEAAEDGLDLRSYPLPAVRDPSAAKVVGELELSEATVAYATQAAGARVDPQRLSRLIGARPPLPEPEEILAKVAAAGENAGDALQNFNPPHAGYRALRAKLAELRSARISGEVQFAEAETASADDRSPTLSRGRRSIGSADRSNSRIEAEIISNMERWRWLPREMGDSRIEVNVPGFELSVVRDGAVSHRARVIVGKEQTPTPIFSNRMQFIIVNPYWNVPPSILNKEMLPKHGGDLAAIEQSGFEVLHRHGQVFVRQRPGERNALGRIKFMFPNDFSVYLHDTPSHGLFSATHRAFSHGCVRVDQPFRLAEAVLGPGSGWPEERVRRLIGGSERYINLARPLPIHIEYFTAYVDERGRLQLRGDLYGYSAKVRVALGLDG